MERKSLAKNVLYCLIYLSSWIGALIILIGDKEADTDVRYNVFQSLILLAVTIITCGIGSIISLIFAIIALVTGEAPKLPWIGDKCREWAQK